MVPTRRTLYLCYRTQDALNATICGSNLPEPRFWTLLLLGKRGPHWSTKLLESVCFFAPVLACLPTKLQAEAAFQHSLRQVKMQPSGEPEPILPASVQDNYGWEAYFSSSVFIAPSTSRIQRAVYVERDLRFPRNAPTRLSETWLNSTVSSPP
jgi:hypothetical protein